MPTRTTSALFSLRSAISCAIRVKARCKAAALRTTVESGIKKIESAQMPQADSTDDVRYSLPWRPHGIALKGRPENRRQDPDGLADGWRLRRHLLRCLMIQSVNARSKPISCPAFCDSIHLCF